MKECKKCKKLKSLDSFVNRYTRYKDGKDTWCKDCKRNSTRIMKYGINNEDYINLLIKQEYKCVICKIHEDDLLKNNNKIYFPLCIDHSHKTNKVRGLLCHKCNRSIGLLNDDSSILYNAFKYLKEHE